MTNTQYREKSLKQNAVNFLLHTATQIEAQTKAYRGPNCQEAATRCHCKSEVVSAVRGRLLLYGSHDCCPDHN